MKIRKTYRIFALSMSLLMLLSSVGFSADFHFCQGEFKSLAFFKKAKSCHEIAAMQMACHGNKEIVKSCHSENVNCDDNEEDGCCENNTELMQLDIDYSFGGLAVENTVEVHNHLAILPNNPRFDFSAFTYPAQYQNYKPPLLVDNLTICFQCFLC